MRSGWIRFAIVLVIGVLLSPSSWAADGRIEINQSSVDAAGGFPFVIDAPGSYVLTSDLVVTTDVTAISIPFAVQSGVRIDLNGFRIVGPASCASQSCPEGSASAIEAQLFVANHAVRDGEIQGFSGTCVLLPAAARVEDLRVTDCGGHGISVGNGGVVLGNQVASVGRSGLTLGTGTVFANNTVSFTGQGGGSEPAVSGGKETGGNYCADRSCGAFPRRHFYLTTDFHDGADAPGVCAPGFHFASLYEVLDPTQLEYDASRGFVQADSGEGPPKGSLGWIRTGDISSGLQNFPGVANCDAWTSRSGMQAGTSATFGVVWDVSSVAISPWSSTTRACNVGQRVWCVQD